MKQKGIVMSDKKAKEPQKPIEINIKKDSEKRRKIAIVGSASSTVKFVPWDDHSLEIWALAWRSIPRADRLFDLHAGNFDKKKRANVQQNYEERLAGFKNTEIYLCEKHPDIPNSVEYPLEAVLKMMGPELDPSSHGQYFASSIAFLICLAIYEKVDEIHIYGVDFVGQGEYEHQRPNMEYLVGVARGKGIEVYIPKGCALVEFSYIYGYQLPPDAGIVNRAVLTDRLKQYKEKHEKALNVARTTDGAIQEVEQLLQMLMHVERGGALEVPPIKEHVEVALNKLEREKEEKHG